MTFLIVATEKKIKTSALWRVKRALVKAYLVSETMVCPAWGVVLDGFFLPIGRGSFFRSCSWWLEEEMSHTGSGIWILGFQMVGLFGEEAQPCWRKYVTDSVLAEFLEAC